MPPGVYNIEIYRGDDWELPLFLREDETTYMDLTGWTGLAQVRQSEDSVQVEATITVTVLNQGTALGGLLLTIDKTITAALTITSGKWDLELTDDVGETYTYLKGSVTVTKDVSRAP